MTVLERSLFHSTVVRIFVRIFVKIFVRIFVSLLNRGPDSVLRLANSSPEVVGVEYAVLHDGFV